MTFLLDTNVISELRKPADRADPGVHAWARSKRTSELWLSVITVMEVEISVGQGGTARPPTGRDPAPLAEA